MKIKKSILYDVIANIEASTYACSICERIVFPKVKINSGNDICIIMDVDELCGGERNQAIKKYICPSCREAFNMILPRLIKKSYDKV